ncbi:hypothetical protein DFP72DRAFT_913914 [Ephemerocybe angulata]|uniref:MYND-type domain-containing protein n=1 Tax=Ephemerocybe angulata TaxID=980116 RepID=A0A8H6M2L4_9AGAR|nr:hypothetical protein DFP72DRAFT_913914 [Tulosesus angulatus]
MSRVSGRTVNKPTPLAQLIAKANDGSPDRLWDLYRYVTEPDMVTLDVILCALKQFSTGDLPDPDSSIATRGQIAGDRAVVSIFLLNFAIHAFRTNSALKEQAVQPVLQSLDAICVWADYCIHFKLAPPRGPTRPGGITGFMETYHEVGRLFMELVTDHPTQTSRALMVSTPFHNLAVRTWMTRDVNADLNYDGLYPALHLLLYALGDREIEGEDAAETFVQQMTNRPPRWLATFAAMTIERSHRIPAMVFRSDVDFRDVPTFAYLLVDILTQITSRCESVRRAFIHADYLKQITSDLNNLSLGLVRRGSPNLLISLVPAIGTLIPHIFDTRTPFRSIKNARDVIAGGIFSTLLRIMASPEGRDPRHTGPVIETIHLLARYTAYPEVVIEISRIPPLDAYTMVGLVRNPQIHVAWMALRTANEGKLAAFRTLKGGSPICDNYSCRRTDIDTRGTPETKEFKKCGGCSSVVYCSVDCQKADWVALHQAECKSSRDEHARRRSSQSWYTHHMRAYHVSYVAFLYNTYFSPKMEARSDIAARTAIASFEAFDVVVVPGVVSLLGDDWWTSHSQLQFPQDYLRPRLSALKEAYISGTGSSTREGVEEVRLVQSYFPLGMKLGVILTVELTRTSGGKYNGGYSIVRYGVPAPNVQSRELARR